MSELHEAAKIGDLVAVVKALDSGFDLTNKVEGMTALHFACLYGHIECAKELIKRGCDIEQCDDYGLTAFGVACRGNNVDLALILIYPYGANIKTRSKAKRTAYQDFDKATIAKFFAQAKLADY